LKEKLKKYVDLLKKCPHSNEEMVFFSFLACMLAEKKYEYRE
jgi:hypothetical protein